MVVDSCMARPFSGDVGERLRIGDDAGELASRRLADADQFVEVEGAALDFPVEAVARDSGLDSGLLLR